MLPDNIEQNDAVLSGGNRIHHPAYIARLRLNPVTSPNSEILIGLEFLFYGPVWG